MSQNELRGTREELRAARDELCNKAALLDVAHREVSEAASSVERLTGKCHGLRRDLHRQETLVVHRDGAIASPKDEVCTQWASGWLAFQKKAASAYPDLDFNSISIVTRRLKSPFPPTILESRTPLLRPAPRLHLLTSELLHVALLVFFHVGLRTRDMCNITINESPILYSVAFIIIIIILFLHHYHKTYDGG